MTEQVIESRIRGFISLTAHPWGCAENVRSQLATVRAAGLTGAPTAGFGNVLVLGSSTGYGLASSLTAVFGYGARTLGVCFERPSSEDKAGSAGWYNLAEAHRLARTEGRQLETINGDAFSAKVKQQVIAALRERFGPLDLLVYSLAAPRRVGPDGTVWQSTLKPVGEPFSGKSIDLRTHSVATISLDPATAEEIDGTVRVMGGDDWRDWVEALRAADLLAPGFRTVAYSYIGPPLTRAIYRTGTIGHAKEHLEATAGVLAAELRDVGGNAWVSVNKAIVTQASAAIPCVPLYMSIVFKLMKELGTHEGAIEQAIRLFRDHLGPGATPRIDEAGLIRLDDLELEPTVQMAVQQIWDRVSTENLDEVTDYAEYQRAFAQLFGFAWPGIDYAAPAEVHRTLEG